MKVIAINGSPRKNGNTAILLGKALEGAAVAGAETELVHLGDMLFHGCISCFSCKRIGGKSYGKCAVNDSLTPVLESLETASAIILGSPFYFGRETGQLLSFMERLLFQYLVYDSQYSNLFGRKIPAGFIYTMNVTKEQAKTFGYFAKTAANESLLSRFFGSCETLMAYDTYQFDDYSKYECSAFSEDHKASVKAAQFPIDCQNAFEMGRRFAVTA